MTKKKGASTNSNLRKAAKVKNDEFFTPLNEIEKELVYYKDHFKNKIVYCNCDDPYRSNFVKYFALNFKFLGLKQLIATCYKNPDRDDTNFPEVSNKPIKWVYNGEQIHNENLPDISKAIVTELKGDGDFRSEECLEILKQCDIVATNPPYNLFFEFVDIIINLNKDFITLGGITAIASKNIFNLIKDNKVWVGYNKSKGNVEFIKEDLSTFELPSYWYTSLEHNKRNEELILYKSYNDEEYFKYDNFNAIEVGKVKDIPNDYLGLMGVPITFINKYSPTQFEILGISSDSEFCNFSKEYVNTKMYNSKGELKSSNTNINSALCIKHNIIPDKGTYYTADNIDYYITKPYARVFIKNKRPIIRFN